MKIINKNIIYNDKQIQNLELNFCGYYCHCFITNQNKVQTANEILLDLFKQPTVFK